MKTKRRILADGVAEAPPGTFSNAIAVGRTIYVSGQTASEPDGAIDGDNDVHRQSVRAFERSRRC